jgi:poly-gamma-glutamate capsule biosynthesis protein CapA/YwtB (metallophosphatase superfamily)
MTQQDLLTLAQQGNPQAIATLINKVAQKIGIKVTATRRGNILYMMFSGEQLPSQHGCVKFVTQGLQKLNLIDIESVLIYGKKNQDKAPLWADKIELFPNTYSPIKPDINTEKTEPLPINTQSVNSQQFSRKKHNNFNQKIPLLIFGGTSLIIAGGTSFISSQFILDPTQQPVKPLFSQTPGQTDNKIAINSVVNVKPIADKNTTITLKAVGDMVPGTVHSKTKSVQEKMLMFDNIKPFLTGADILFGNFESTLTNYPFPAKDTSQNMVFAFRTAPSYSKFLKATGFDVLSVANNHSFDYSPKGFSDTLENIKKAGLEYVGEKNQILYINEKGLKIAFIGFSFLKEHNHINDLETGKKLVQEAKQKANIVIVSFHGGAEGSGAVNVRNQTEMFYGENRGNLVLFSRTMIDSGADLVLGHGPHVVRSMELYKGKLIAYSLGNFLGDGALSSQSILSNSMVLDVTLNGEGEFVTGNIIPVKINPKGIPYHDKQFTTVKMVQNLTKTDFPQTGISIDNQGKITKKSP